MCKKNCLCENSKYLESSIGDAIFLCDENIEMTKTVPTKIIQTKSTLTKIIPTSFFKKKLTCKRDKTLIKTTTKITTLLYNNIMKKWEIIWKK